MVFLSLFVEVLCATEPATTKNKHNWSWLTSANSYYHWNSRKSERRWDARQSFVATERETATLEKSFRGFKIILQINMSCLQITPELYASPRCAVTFVGSCTWTCSKTTLFASWELEVCVCCVLKAGLEDLLICMSNTWTCYWVRKCRKCPSSKVLLLRSI